MGPDRQRFIPGEAQRLDSALRESRQMLAAERESAERLQQVATKLISAEGVQALYEESLDALQAITGADFASIQMFHPDYGSQGQLRLIGHRGFSEQAATRWEWVSFATRTSCGEALRTGKKVTVQDVRFCDFLTNSEELAAYQDAGIRAVQSLPLVSRSGALIGMVSTHWREPHEPSATEARAVDVLARLLADLLERSRAEEKARESEERLRFAQEAADIGSFDSNLETGLATWTPKLEEMYGLPPGSFHGGLADWLNLIHPDDRRRVEVRLWESFETGSFTEEEWRVIWPDQSVRWLAGRWRVFQNAEGKPSRLRGASLDITDRKRIEQTLRESEERFRHIADTAPVMIWIADPDNLGTFFNKAWLDFTGRSMEQELGEGWIRSVHPDDLERCLAMCGSSVAARRAFQRVFRLRRADGEYRWVLDNGAPHYLGSEFAGFIGSCVDITDQKRIEEELRTNQNQLMDSQRLANVGSWQLDVATRVTHYSEEWYRIFGLSRDCEPDFSTFFNCVHPKDRGIVAEAEKRAHTADAPFVVEFRIIRPDGETRFIRSMVEAFRNDDGALIQVGGATQDITEQVQATERLRESEARLKDAERMTHVGHWTWDLKTNEVSWSEEIYQILGQPEDYVPRYESYVELVAPSDRVRFQASLANCLREKRGRVMEYRIIRPNGEVRTLVSTSQVHLDEEGAPTRVFGACQDVTEARQAQEENFARQKLESLGTLAGGIAHDFNNLLGSVLAQTELAVVELAAGSHATEQLNAIRELSIRGSEIVRQLMIYAGRESDVLEAVDLSGVVKEILDLLKVAVSRRATLMTNLGENLPAVRARAAQISQIVMNLVVNASEALGDQDGVVRITTKRRSLGQSEAAAKALPSGDYICLEVSDTGCGMPLELQAKVFDPFFTTKFSGRGLGLAVVQGIVRSLRGATQLASEPGKGTRFEILLPCADAGRKPDSAPALPAQETPRGGPRATVLMVEDEERLRTAAAKMLRKAGLNVIEAGSGSEAIDLIHARGGEFDLILLDLTLPGRSSQEVAAEAALARPGVKVVLTSAYSAEVATTAVDSPLVCKFIRKPFTISDLVQTLRSVLADC
jgi:PAS domain S-box-containing protein